MPIVQNSLYSDPQVAGIVSNLATAIYGDPQARMRRDLYGAQTENYRANADKLGAETRGIDLKNSATSGIAGIFDGPGTPAENFRSNFSRVAPLIIQAGGGNADQLSGGLNNLFSSYYGLGDDNDMTRASVLQGHTPGKDFAPSVARADAVAGRDAGYVHADKVDEANIRAGADRDVARINQGGALDRLFGAPVVAKAGEDTYLAPNDPRRLSIGQDGVVQGAPTLNTVRGEAGERILDLPAGEAPSSNIATVFAGGGRNGTAAPGAKPHPVNGKNLNDAVMAAGAMIKGATSVQANGKTMLDPEFEASFGADKVAAARNAAGAELARSGDAQKAAGAYLSALGVQPGSEFGSQGGFFGLGSHKGITAPQAAPAPAAPTAAPVRITGDADYARLPQGASYIAPDGSVRTKR